MTEEERNEQTDLALIREWWDRDRTTMTLLQNNMRVFEEGSDWMQHFPSNYIEPFQLLIGQVITQAAPELFTFENCGVTTLPSSLIEIDGKLDAVVVKSRGLAYSIVTPAGYPDLLTSDEQVVHLAKYIIEFYTSLLENNYKILLYTLLSPCKLMDENPNLLSFGFITRFAQHSL